MLPTRLAEIQHCIGFSAADAEALSELLARCGDALQQVTEALDRQIEQELDATRLANDSPAERARLKRLLGGWLRSLLQGPYDEDYWRKRRRIGQRHVEVKLPQYYMCMAMQVVQRELEAIARRLYQTEPDRQERLRAAIRKICYLDLSIMLDSYQSHYQARIRQAERRVRQRLEAQLAAQQSFAKTLLDNAAVGVMAFDSSGRLTSYNRKMQEIFGYTADEIARRREWLSRAFPDPQDCQEAEQYFTALASGNVPEG
ncbi:MAG: protoglobin domain-containing protein, partial [Phycisphaerae bacterium]